MTAAQRAARILSAWLPNLVIEQWARIADACPEPSRGAPDQPVALTLDSAHGPVIHAVTAAAASQGARPGMRLTDARALNPQLKIAEADPAGERTSLERLANWASRWSPLVEVDGADGLRLDIAGVAHLFGGERKVIADMEQAFARLGLTLRAAVAPTPAAAWALARFGRSGAICRGDVAQALAPLPVAALRLSPLATRTLERLGLKTIEALAGIERRSLARRFREADNPLDALDRALGRKPEPLTAIHCPAPPRAGLRLAEPVTHPEAAAQALAILIPRLVGELETRKLGARHLSLTGFRVDGSLAAVTVATSIATRELGHLQRLLDGAIERSAGSLDPGFGIDAFMLTADWAEPLGAAQDSLVGKPSGEVEIARLIDRLSVKLGAARVRRPCAQASHLPERASGWEAAVSPASGKGSHGPSRGKIRPQRLLDRPEAIAVLYATPEGLPRRFVWRRVVHDIARVAGPERIAPEWWRQASGARLRDYYQIEDSAGRRYWIYREGVIGDGRGADRQGLAPAWFIHGLFG
ncbi:MAG: DNA polymerase Y family protein [Sphingomicrobium sp.]